MIPSFQRRPHMKSAMAKRYAVPAVAFALFTALPAIGSAATITQILGSPSSYDGHHVDVRGTVEHLARSVLHQGNPFVTFSLCSHECIQVFAFGNPTTSNGQTITVHGTYEKVNHLNGYTLQNGIEADGGAGDSEAPCS
jgi:hypothetical protein